MAPRLDVVSENFIGIRFALVAVAFLAVSAALFAGDEFTFWAPGTVNPSEGTIEMEIDLLRPRSAMTDDWYFALRLPGNSRDNGPSLLALVFCPPGDARNFAAVAKTGSGSATANVAHPPFEPGRTYRVAMAWGHGELTLAVNGQVMARDPFKGELLTLPETFTAGRADAIKVTALRLSDTSRRGDAEHSSAPLEPDEHSTLVWKQGREPTLGQTRWQRESFVAGLFPVRRDARFAFNVDEPLTIPVCAVNHGNSPIRATAILEIRNRHGDLIGQHSTSLDVAPGAPYSRSLLTFPSISESGYYELSLRTATANHPEGIRYDLACVVQPPTTPGPRGKFADFLGHHDPVSEKPDSYTQIGIHWDRTWSNSRVFTWSSVEPISGVFQWQRADTYVRQTEAAGIHVLGVLGYPPVWASTFSASELKRVKIKSSPDYTGRPDRYAPKKLSEWKAYVRAVVSRYHDRVKYWEIYNEVDFHPPFLHASFSGSTADYLELLAAANEVIHDVDPSCQVLTSGFSLVSVTDPTMVADLMHMGAASDFDIFSVHAYADRAVIAKAIEVARLAKRNVPLWQTERQYMGGFRDEYQVVCTLFWCIEHGFSKYFLHEADLDRNYGQLKPTPYYAVTAEIARQLSSCDTFVGAVPSRGASCVSWQLRRSDGSYLQVFASDHGRLRLSFESTDPAVLVEITGLYGETVYKGTLGTNRSFTVSDLIYVTSSFPLTLTNCEQDAGNVLANSSFEMRTGDLIMTGSAAPTYWTLTPSDASAPAPRFAPGHSGEYALEFDPRFIAKGGALSQETQADRTGLWRLSAYARVSQPGTKAELRLAVEPSKSGRTGPQHRTVTLDPNAQWQRIELDVRVADAPTALRVIVAPLASSSPLEIDDVELTPVMVP